MIDVEKIKETTDMLALVEQDTPLRKLATTRGGEYAGPCPLCGGRDRFHVQPAAGTFMCRNCHPNWGDLIEYTQWTKHLEFRQACAALQPTAAGKPNQLPTITRSNAQLPTQPPPWQERGLRFLQDSQSALWSANGRKALQWLHARGLKDDTIRNWGLGYHQTKEWQDPALWQLQDRDKKVYLPPGVVIPWLLEGELWQLKVRALEHEDGPKILSIPGGHPALYGAHTLEGRDTAVLTEGEFDCMLLWQEAGDLVGTATLGSCTASPNDQTVQHLLTVKHILIAYDADQQGQRGAANWTWTRRARRITLPLNDSEGKDITDLWKADHDVRAWLTTHLANMPQAQRGVKSAVEVLTKGPTTQQQAVANGNKSLCVRCGNPTEPDALTEFCTPCCIELARENLAAQKKHLHGGQN